MPIKRFRSIEDVPPPEGHDPNDPEARRKAEAYFGELSHQLPPLFPPGIYKYRSIEEAGAAKEAAIIARARALRRK
ncbi:MAG: hypothetical protein WDA15_01950 [Trueperaceae bacterium]